MSIEELEFTLVESGFDVKEKRELDWGVQLRMANGAIVNLYSNKKGWQKIVLGGKNSEELNLVIDKLKNNINT